MHWGRANRAAAAARTLLAAAGLGLACALFVTLALALLRVDPLCVCHSAIGQTVTLTRPGTPRAVRAGVPRELASAAGGPCKNVVLAKERRSCKRTTFSQRISSHKGALEARAACASQSTGRGLAVAECLNSFFGTTADGAVEAERLEPRRTLLCLALTAASGVPAASLLALALLSAPARRRARRVAPCRARSSLRRRARDRRGGVAGQVRGLSLGVQGGAATAGKSPAGPSDAHPTDPCPHAGTMARSGAGSALTARRRGPAALALREPRHGGRRGVPLRDDAGPRPGAARGAHRPRARRRAAVTGAGAGVNPHVGWAARGPSMRGGARGQRAGWLCMGGGGKALHGRKQR